MTIKWPSLIKKLRLDATLIIGRHPALYFPVANLYPRARNQLVRRDTQMVIEGFPRSANTYAVAAFIHSQTETVKIAHHLHVPAQVIRAISLSIPTIVLIRNPRDAVLSLMMREPLFSPNKLLRYYALYYGTLFDYRREFVLAPFDQVTDDFGKIIASVNKRFGTNFSPFKHTASNLEMVFKIVERMDLADHGGDNINQLTVARPSEDRRRLQTDFQNQLADALETSVGREATEVFKRFVCGQAQDVAQ